MRIESQPEQNEKNPRRVLIICREGEISRDELELFIRKLQKEGDVVIVEEKNKNDVIDLDEIRANLEAKHVEFNEAITVDTLRSRYSSSKEYAESFRAPPNLPKQHPRTARRIFRKQNR